MVGTFISKYLLVTTSTITVTSSAAVTFFVAKHLKVGKGYEKAMDYIKSEYESVRDVLLEKRQDEGAILSGISRFILELKEVCLRIEGSEIKAEDLKKNFDKCSSNLFLMKNNYEDIKKLIDSWDSSKFLEKASTLKSILDSAGIVVDDYDGNK